MSRQIAIRMWEKDKTISTWFFLNLSKCNSPYLYKDLYKDIVEERFNAPVSFDEQCKNYKLKSVKAQMSPDSDPIIGDVNEDMLPAIDVFKMLYFNLTQEHSGECQCKSLKETETAQKPNAFQAMMLSARQNCANDFPQKIDNPKSGKDYLWNEFLSFIEENNCKFQKGSSLPKSFVSKTVDLLFYVDGHYSAMAEHVPGVGIPSLFTQRFSQFNRPEASKHRKKSLENLNQEKLDIKVVNLKISLQAQSFKTPEWVPVIKELERLMDFVDAYGKYLLRQKRRMKFQGEEQKNVSEKTNIHFCKVNNKPQVNQNIILLNKKLKEALLYTPVNINEQTALIDRRRLHDLIDIVQTEGLEVPCVLFIHEVGGNKSNMNFVWKIEEGGKKEDVLKTCVDVIKQLEKEMPVFESKVTKKMFMQRYGTVASKVALRSMFSNLTCDMSEAPNLNTKEINKRFHEALLTEDPDILVDLRHQAPCHKKDRFRDFFTETEKYLNEEIGVAVQERRHGEQLYLAKAVSFKDLHKRVSEKVPEGTAIPSVKWLRYQAQPRYPQAKTAKLYYGRINIKMMVQKRQVSSSVCFIWLLYCYC